MTVDRSTQRRSNFQVSVAWELGFLRRFQEAAAAQTRRREKSRLPTEHFAGRSVLRTESRFCELVGGAFRLGELIDWTRFTDADKAYLGCGFECGRISDLYGSQFHRLV